MDLKIPTVSDINSMVGKFQLPLAAAGFVYGALADNWSDLTSGPYDTVEKKAKWILQKLANKTAGISLYQGYGQSPRSFNPTGFLNKGLLLYLVQWIYKEMGLPYHVTVSKILEPLGLGWAIGGLFDPPIDNPAPARMPLQTNTAPAGVQNGAPGRNMTSIWGR